MIAIIDEENKNVTPRILFEWQSHINTYTQLHTHSHKQTNNKNKRCLQ